MAFDNCRDALLDVVCSYVDGQTGQCSAANDPCKGSEALAAASRTAQSNLADVGKLFGDDVDIVGTCRNFRNRRNNRTG